MRTVGLAPCVPAASSPTDSADPLRQRAPYGCSGSACRRTRTRAEQLFVVRVLCTPPATTVYPRSPREYGEKYKNRGVFSQSRECPPEPYATYPLIYPHCPQFSFLISPSPLLGDGAPSCRFHFQFRIPVSVRLSPLHSVRPLCIPRNMPVNTTFSSCQFFVIPNSVCNLWITLFVPCTERIDNTKKARLASRFRGQLSAVPNAATFPKSDTPILPFGRDVLPAKIHPPYGLYSSPSPAPPRGSCAS